MSLTIRESIKKLSKTSDKIYSVIAKVTEVDEDARTVDVEPLDGSAELFGINLQADQESSAGCVNIPKVDSNVIVTFLSKSTAFVSLCTEVDKVLIDTPEVTINGGDNDGLLNIRELRQELNKEKARVDTIIQALQSSATGVQDGGATYKANITGFVSGLQAPDYSDMEDTKVTH